MHLFKSPKASKGFLIANLIAWCCITISNFIIRFSNGLETLESGIANIVILLVTYISFSLVFREIIHQFSWQEKSLHKSWWLLVITAVLLGFFCFLFNVFLTGIYYILAGFSTSLVFFLNGLYSNLFINTVLLLLWSSLYILFTHNQKLLELKDKSSALALELKNAQLNTLNNQLNPHFLFNSLNNIRSLILEDSHKARDSVTNLSDLLRYSLKSDNKHLCLLSEELEMVRCYIDIASIQYEDRLNYQQCIECDEFLLIPPMLIQMLIENSIKHGIAKSVVGGKISLHIFEKNNSLIIKVSNPGQITSHTRPTTRLGIKNIEQRLNLLFSEEASFELVNTDNQVLATVKIPVTREIAYVENNNH